ncbi:MBL fold metallo-hydrolase [Paenibacillus polymyxa]|uniref:MBL fold metallo-hydrolase n=1 Tax=Paenibacillus polymyxa TaxID=1406 RepID=UPI00058A2F8C|nr:MBL fold metallo-hydrolase [Paenibacillus polymyxa]AJE53847.1 metallo-beta-lactamase family protein [Paenibacillus polymyxa]QOH62213.1 MBL fold metallo-hydrolase [Paenibacillus polymyxa]
MANHLFTEGMTANEEAAPDLLSLRTLFVNVCFIGEPGSRSWVLVDTGMAGFTDSIIRLAEERFSGPPVAIVLTHGHFDHVGSVIELVQHWGTPVYAHPLELPYLTGMKDYQKPDPSVGGGLMSGISFLYPNDAIDLDDRITSLPRDGSIPGAPGWKWLHTPGHTPGHVSLFHEQRRLMVAGDAFITVKQESALAVLLQEKEIHGPPAYFTTDWQAAQRSVKMLAGLKPAIAVTGHGHFMQGTELTDQLERLAGNFEHMAVPKQGRYV